MDAKTYVEYALRTESSDNNIFQIKVLQKFTKFLNCIGLSLEGYISGRMIKQSNIRLLHFGIGLATEVSEIIEFLEKNDLDFVNLAEEIGDVNWYFSIPINELKFSPYILDLKSDKILKENINVKRELELSALVLAKESGIILDYLKKMVFYGKSVDQKLIQVKIESIIKEMEYMSRCANFDIVKTRQINIDKLAKRYGEKFSEYNAVNRKLEEERVILNKIKQ